MTDEHHRQQDLLENQQEYSAIRAELNTMGGKNAINAMQSAIIDLRDVSLRPNTKRQSVHFNA